MIRHLIGGGPNRRDVLTECSLMAVIPGSLVTDVVSVDCTACRRSLINRGICPECGDPALAWNASTVDAEFYLACGKCSKGPFSEVSADRAAEALTVFGWRPI